MRNISLLRCVTWGVVVSAAFLSGVAYAADTDGDGMDDAWETTHFGDLSRDGTGDADLDGCTDLVEHDNATDPNDRDSYPTVVVTFPDSGLDAKVRSAIGKPTGDIYNTDLIGTGFTSLTASSSSISDLSGLEYCIDLIHLYLSDNQITDVSPLPGLTNLTYLYLSDNQITDVSPLSGLTNLTHLYLYNNQIADISELSGLTNLTTLWLRDNQISNVSSLSGLTNLTHLDLQSNQITEVSPLSGLTNLTVLYLAGNQIMDVSGLSGLTTNLMRLELDNNQLTDVSALSGLTNLTYLSLHSNQLTEVSPLSGLTNLTNLYLHSNQFTDVSPLSGMTNLTELHLEYNQLTDVSPLSGLTNLTQIYLSGNQLTDVSPLSGLTNLTSLYLRSNQITDVPSLSGMTNLYYLSLDNNQITDVSPLSGLTNLRHLHLSYNQITDVSPLSDLANLMNLYLGSNQITDVLPLSGLTSLRHLYLDSNQITDISPLVANTGLSLGDELYLQYNPLSITALSVDVPALEARGVTVHATGAGDTDNDGMADGWETDNFGDLSHDDTGDTDSDGLSDYDEFRYHTGPNSMDTDLDGYSDGDEVNVHGTNPLNFLSNPGGQVTVSGGYAIIVVGKVDENGEGLREHSLTAENAYAAFRRRGLSDDNIYYMSEIPAMSPDVIVDDATPSKQDLQWAIETWAVGKTSAEDAPVYLVMIDHGKKEIFYIYSGEYGAAAELTPSELDGYLDTLEATATKGVMTVIGSCYSGSFVPALSAPGRIIITSAAAYEVSHRGGKQKGIDLRDGEAFVTELFRDLARGRNVYQSVINATGQVSDRIESLAERWRQRNGKPRKSTQNPVLDDNGDGAGTLSCDLGTFSFGGDEGYLAKATVLGEYTVTAIAPPEWVGVDTAGSQFYWTVIDPGQSAVLEIEAEDVITKGDTLNAWLELKTPDYTGAGLALDDHQEFQQAAELDIFDAPTQVGNLFSWNLGAALDIPGAYEVFFNVSDSGTNLTGEPVKMMVYRALAGNQAPPAVALVYPANGVEISTTTWFAWNPVTDPEGDAISYRIEFALDENFSNIQVSKGNITAAWTTIDGLQDLTDYYWRVIPVDEYGAQPGANEYRHNLCNNTNMALDAALRVIVRDYDTDASIADATVEIVSAGILQLTDQDGQIFITGLSGGAYTIDVSADGYTSGRDIVNVLDGAVVTAPVKLKQLITKGSLTVVIAPGEAVNNGAQWSLNGGATWLDSGVTAANLVPGEYTITYNAVTDWMSLASEYVAITAGAATLKNATYVSTVDEVGAPLSIGGVCVTLDSATKAGVPSGAQWRVDSGSWKDSGEVVLGLSTGTHTLSYTPLPEWEPPADKAIEITANTVLEEHASYSVAPVAVPNVVGITRANAESAITGAGLIVGSVSEQYSDTIAIGLVISQTPAAGTSLVPGSSVSFTISLGGIPDVTVPNVSGITRANAETAITDAGLAVGSVTEQYSDTIAVGLVISQTPAASTSLAPGSSVSFTISLGEAPVVPPSDVTVPDLVGITRANAESAITDAGLVVGSVTEQYSDTIAVGLVISQTPAAGTSLAPGSSVSFTISLGEAPVVPVAVPNVSGMTRANAESAITGAGLIVGSVSEQYSDTVAVGLVISQTPASGTSLAPGSSVGFTISRGKQPSGGGSDGGGCKSAIAFAPPGVGNGPGSDAASTMGLLAACLCMALLMLSLSKKQTA